MEYLIMSKHTVENLVKDFECATSLCDSMAKRISDAAFAIENIGIEVRAKGVIVASPTEHCCAIYDARNILTLLSERFEKTGTILSHIVAPPAVILPDLPHLKASVPEDLDVSAFDDISSEELVLEARRQDEIIAAAMIDKAIIAETLARRTDTAEDIR